MKKISYILVFFLIFMSFQAKINGVWENNGNGGTANDHSNASGLYPWTYGYGYGIRLSLVDENGNRISGTKSFDFISQGASLYNLYSVSSKPDRYEVVNGSIAANFTSGYTGYEQKTLPAFVNVGADAYKNLVNYLEGYLTKKENGKAVVNEQGTNEIFSKLGTTYDAFLKDCKRNVYLAVETIILFKNSTNGGIYVGTVSEFAKWASTSSDVLSGVRLTFRDGTMPLSLYSDTPKAGVSAVQRFQNNNNIFNDMNKVTNGLVPGYGIFLFYLNEILNCNEEPPPKPDICDFSLDVKIPQNCGSAGNTGYIRDIEDWSCIFMSTLASQNVGNTKIANHFYEWENSYCAVYCREWVDIEYPGNDMTVLAGTHFVIGSEYIPNGPSNFILPRLSPIRFAGRSECRVTKNKNNKNDTNINYDQFKVDFKNANDAVNTAWNDYQQKVANRKAAQNAACNYSGSGSCYKTECDPPDKDGKRNCYRVKTGDYDSYSCSGTATHGVYRGSDSWGYTTRCNISGNTKSQEISAMQSIENSAYSTYQSRINTRNYILQEVKNCNNFVMKNEAFNPEVDFQYTEPVYGRAINNLNKSLTINTQTNYYSSNGNVTGTVRRENVNFNSYTSLSNNSDFVTTSANNAVTSTIDTWSCTSGQRCVNVKTTYPSNPWLRQFTTKTYEYSLPNGIYKNVLKPSGESYNTLGEVGISRNSEGIPYSNLPVHFSTPNGSYNYQIKFNTLGSNHKFDYYIFKGGTIGQTFGEFYDVYYLMLTKPNISSLLRHCDAADHLGHGMANQLRNEGLLNDFLNSSCAKQHNCYASGSNVICTRYESSPGKWSTYSPGWTTPASYTTYNQLTNCITEYAMHTTGTTAFSGTTTYQCRYYVQNKIIKEDSPGKFKDINVIFRPISLDNPFPRIDAKGRVPGDNWNRLGSNGQALYTNYITNNRNVKTEKVYKLDPLYKIILNPGLIKNIRKYNDEQDSKTVTYYRQKSKRVTGIEGYSDFELDCDNHSRNCKSTFIRSTFSKFFTGCGIKGKNNGLKCSTNDAW